jgi:hypothetical protein
VDEEEQIDDGWCKVLGAVFCRANLADNNPDHCLGAVLVIANHHKKAKGMSIYRIRFIPHPRRASLLSAGQVSSDFRQVSASRAEVFVGEIYDSLALAKAECDKFNIKCNSETNPAHNPAWAGKFVVVARHPKSGDWIDADDV